MFFANIRGHVINRSVILSFVDCFNMPMPNPDLNTFKLLVRNFLMSLGRAAEHAAKNRISKMEERVLERGSSRSSLGFWLSIA